MSSTAKLLSKAKNAAGANAEIAASAKCHAEARRWSNLATRIDRLMQEAIHIAANPDEKENTQ